MEVTPVIALKICDIKEFTKKLLVGTTFDWFLVKEAVIVTFNTFSIDGRIRHGYYSEEELEAEHIEDFSSWSLLRPYCYSLIKGKKLPESFSIVLRLPPRQTEKLLEASRCTWQPEQIGGLFLNIRYESHLLTCITGLSLNVFSPDRTLEREWDDAVRAFFRKEGIPFTEE